MFGVILKIFLSLAGVLGLIFLAGITGMMFFFWPTTFVDHSLGVTQRELSELSVLQQEKKFLENLPNHYPGAPNEAIRMNAQRSVDVLIQTLVVKLPSHPHRSFVLGTMKTALASFRNHDTEEQEQMLLYCERILAILGIKGSGELFNVWRYGFPYGWLSRA